MHILTSVESIFASIMNILNKAKQIKTDAAAKPVLISQNVMLDAMILERKTTNSIFTNTSIAYINAIL